MWGSLRLTPTNPRRVHETKFCHHKSDLISVTCYFWWSIWNTLMHYDTNKRALTLNVLWLVYYVNPMFHILRGNLVIIHLFIHTYFPLINCLQCTYLWPAKWKPRTSRILWNRDKTRNQYWCVKNRSIRVLMFLSYGAKWIANAECNFRENAIFFYVVMVNFNASVCYRVT